jgi:Fe-S-cluster-containing hydrogenase component 2
MYQYVNLLVHKRVIREVLSRGVRMKRIVVKQELCTKCHKCEEVCSEAFFKVNDSKKSAIRIDDSSDEPVNVCNQCGECIDICSEETLARAKNGVVLLGKKKCVGCFMCVGFCPTLSMRMHEEFVEPFKCTACGLCVKECPTGAITLED